MTNLDKSKLGSGKSKLDLIRNVQLTPASPLTQLQSQPVDVAEQITDPASLLNETANVDFDQRAMSSSVPVPPDPLLPSTAVDETAQQNRMGNKTHFAHHAFTFAFSVDNHAFAQRLASVIGCKIEDIIARIAKRFHTDLLDLNVEIIQPRFGLAKRIVLKINQNTIDVVRSKRDPLNVRSDGYLLRAPVIAALDVIANQVLQELKVQYEN